MPRFILHDGEHYCESANVREHYCTSRRRIIQLFRLVVDSFSGSAFYPEHMYTYATQFCLQDLRINQLVLYYYCIMFSCPLVTTAES
jgi:hypothetical protein